MTTTDELLARLVNLENEAVQARLFSAEDVSADVTRNESTCLNMIDI